MRPLQRAGVGILLCPLLVFAYTPAFAQARDGQHDFDFEIGTWTTHVARLVHPLTGSKTWAQYDGTTVVSKVWNGRANLVELEVGGSSGPLELASLRLYNPDSHQWSLNVASSRSGLMSVPTAGEFNNGRGEFFDQETIDGRAILVRFVISDITADSCHFEQAFSADGGRTWEVNWIATDTRVKEGSSPSAAAAQQLPAEPAQHDFDFAFGVWKTHIKRLLKPLTGSTDWAEYDGTHTIRKVWNGRANLGELEADGPAGHIEAMSPRLYNPQSHQWSVSYGNPRDGSLSQPVSGGFKDGRGEFFGQDTVNGRAVLVREIYSPLGPGSRRLEIAYSADGGKNWQTHWIMTDTRMSD